MESKTLPFTAHTPCGYMRPLLPRLVDGKLGGVLLLYVRAHIKKCNQCTAALNSLIALRDQMRDLGRRTTGDANNRLTAHTRSRLEERLKAMEETG